jgi:hypothetical protein
LENAMFMKEVYPEEWMVHEREQSKKSYKGNI